MNLIEGIVQRKKREQGRDRGGRSVNQIVGIIQLKKRGSGSGWR